MNFENDFHSFDLSCVNIMTGMVRQDAAPELVSEVVEHLRHLKLEHYSLIEKIRILEQKANIDLKTGLYKYNELYLESMIKIASRALDGEENEIYSVSYVRFDLDNFSRLNNEYGHDFGDRVLQSMAKLLQDSTRPTDYCIRFGGEEFDLMLPSTDLDGATKVVEKIFSKFNKLSFRISGKSIKVTTSAGITVFKHLVQTLRNMTRPELIKEYLRIQKEADNALYMSKANGKNQIQVYDPKLKSKYASIRKQYALSTMR